MSETSKTPVWDKVDKSSSQAVDAYTSSTEGRAEIAKAERAEIEKRRSKRK